MPTDVEVESFVSRSTGNASDVNRIGLQDGDVDVVLRKEVRRGQPRRTRTNNCYVCFHFIFKLPSQPE